MMDLSGSENLKEFPNLSKATRLLMLSLNDCRSLVTVPCSIRSLNRLEQLSMRGCTRLESLPTNLNLKSFSYLNLSGCSQLKSFPQISRNIYVLILNYTAIEEVPCWIKYFSNLTKFGMRGCKRLKSISSNMLELERLKVVDFSDCEGVTEFGDAESLKDISHSYHRSVRRLDFQNCFSLDQDAQKLIIQSEFKYAVLPGEQVPKYFTHRACGSSLTIPLPKSSLLEDFLGFKVCIVLEPLTVTEFDLPPCVEVRWYFRGKTGVRRFNFDPVSIKMDHLLMFEFGFPTEEVTEFPPELDYDNAKFEFDTEDSVQRIKGCGMQRHLSPFRYSIFEVYRNLSSFSEDEEGNPYDSFLEDYDNKSLASSDEDFTPNYSTDDEELNFSSFFDEEEVSDNLPVHSTKTPENITQWIFDSTHYCN